VGGTPIPGISSAMVPDNDQLYPDYYLNSN